MFHPALREYPQETALIGLLVVGYAELDLSLCHVCGLALGNKLAVINALHAVTSEQARIDIANRLCRHVFEERKLESKFGDAVGAMDYCRKVRNQYAHSQWADLDGKLAFIRADNVNWKPGGSMPWKFTNLPILQSQESYFAYTRNCLLYLERQWTMPGTRPKWPTHIPQPPLQAGGDPNRYQVQA